MTISYLNEVFRKLIHLSSLWMVAAIYILNDLQSLSLFGLLLIGMIGFEISRRYWSFFKKITSLLLGKILRSHEDNGEKSQLTGAFYVVLAVFLSLLFFSKTITITSLSIMLVADTAAALIGRKFGKNNIFNKTIEGSSAFFLTALIILIISIQLGLNLSIFMAVIIAFIATALELFSHKIRIDDNLSIVIGTGIAITLLQLI